MIQTVDQLVQKLQPDKFLTHSPAQQGDLLCWAYNAAMVGDLRAACAEVVGCE